MKRKRKQLTKHKHTHTRERAQTPQMQRTQTSSHLRMAFSNLRLGSFSEVAVHCEAFEKFISIFFKKITHEKGHVSVLNENDREV